MRLPSQALSTIGGLGLLLACDRTGPTPVRVGSVHSRVADAAVLDATSASPGEPAPIDAARDVGKTDTDAPASSGAWTLRLVAAGDVACDGCSQGATADLIDELVSIDRVAAVLVLGDLAYASGSAAEFQALYAPTWGRAEILRMSHPVPGNHEYASGSANDYFDYFNGTGGALGPAGPRGKGYYSFDLGPWHIVGLNSSDECRFVPCGKDSAQYDWLVADLAAHHSVCTLVFWHHPRFQAGTSSGELTAAAPIWDALYAAGVDVVLNGHEHGYQQLSPLDENGELDVPHGIRTFVVGTGGGDFDTTFGGPRLGALESSITGAHGVLELTLLPTSYQWQFIAIDGNRPSAASGTSFCH